MKVYKSLFTLLFVAATLAHASTLCPNAASIDGFGYTATHVSGSLDSTCGANSAINILLPANNSYGRLEWTALGGATIGSLTGADASVLFAAGQAGDQPFYMESFFAPTLSLGQNAPGDQILFIEFQSGNVSANHMILDPNVTLFNMYDNTTGIYLQGGQQNAKTLNQWLALYSGLSTTALAGLRIGEGLSGGCGNGGCSESLTVDSLRVTTVNSSPTPEPGTMALIGAGLAGLGLVGRRRHNKRT